MFTFCKSAPITSWNVAAATLDERDRLSVRKRQTVCVSCHVYLCARVLLYFENINVCFPVAGSNAYPTVLRVGSESMYDSVFHIGLWWHHRTRWDCVLLTVTDITDTRKMDSDCVGHFRVFSWVQVCVDCCVLHAGLLVAYCHRFDVWMGNSRRIYFISCALGTRICICALCHIYTDWCRSAVKFTSYWFVCSVLRGSCGDVCSDVAI